MARLVGDGIALGVQCREVVERSRNVAVSLHRFERTQHGESVDQAFGRGIQADVAGHVACELRQLERQEFVEIDGFEQAVVERPQHLGRNERDAEGAFARLQVIDRVEGNDGIHRERQRLLRT